VVDGISEGLAAGRTASIREEEQVDGEAEDGRSASILQSLRGADAPAEVSERSIGGSDSVPQEGLLQPSLHGCVDDETCRVTHSRNEPNPRQEESEASVRNLRPDSPLGRSPYGREPIQQRVVQPEDVVHYLSQSLALGTWEAEFETSGAMPGLLKAFQASPILREARGTFPEIWRSATDETRQFVGQFLCARGVRWDLVKILVPTKEQPGRVKLLKGAGNAIVPWVAAEFIRAFLEWEAEQC